MPSTRPLPTVTMDPSEIGVGDTVEIRDQQTGLVREIAASSFTYGAASQTITGDWTFSGDVAFTGDLTHDGDVLGFFGASTPQPINEGNTDGFTAAGGTAVLDRSTFTGGAGTTGYTIHDIVFALKSLGLILS